MLFVVSAPSGAGKTTIIKRVRQEIPKLRFSVSATTREKRNNEIEGKDYYFLTKNEFTKKIDANEFAEWEEVYGEYYGTLKNELESCLGKDADMIFDVDVKGALAIKKLYSEAVTIFIYAPIEQIVNRLHNRKTETDEQINKRIERMKMELTYMDKFDFIIDNETREGNSLEKAVNILIKKINKEN